MLKSTHKPATGPSSLPPGWTEHRAPSGHKYYYSAGSKESTYTRPFEAAQQVSIDYPQHFNGDLAPDTPGGWISRTSKPGSGSQQLNRNFIDNNGDQSRGDYHVNFHVESGQFNGERRNQEHRRGQPPDRPRSKHTIPICAPWLLVSTKLGRRFVFNPEKGESYWKFPPDVMKGVVEYDKLEREKREAKQTSRDEESNKETKIDAQESAEATEATEAIGPAPDVRPVGNTVGEDESDEYEEVLVTDDEFEESAPKRQKTEDDTPVDQAMEFNEDDIAYQLAAMGQDHGLDPGEYGDGQNESWEEGAEGLPLTEEDTNALFKDMLDDYRISPYKTWESIVEHGKIVEDERYVVLSNMKARKEVWGEWSRERIQQVREQREKEEKKDPRLPYLAFLQKYATPKLFWPEFRRKYRKESEMHDGKLSDKEREKWYRDYINRLKLPESTLKSDLTILLKLTPLHLLNRSTSIEALPPAILMDIRYVSVRSAIRDPQIEAYIATSPPAPERSDVSPEEEAEVVKREKERERREHALAQRKSKVEQEKRKQSSNLQHSKDTLREGEEEIQRAMRVGKEGLLGHLEGEEHRIKAQGTASS